MSAITFTSIDFTGTPDDIDRAAAELIVDNENQKRAQEDPPGTPLPVSTPAELKASYLTVLLSTITNAHDSYRGQAMTVEAQNENLTELWKSATDAQRAAAVAALTA